MRKAATPYTMSRVGRLHAGCILDYGTRQLFGAHFDEICSMSSEQRWDRLVLPPGEPDALKPVQERFREAISTIDAWQEIERIRRAALRSNPRGRVK